MTDSFGEYVPPPKRRLRIVLDLHANDWSALSDAWGDIRHAVFLDGSTNATLGGSDAGWHVEVTDNPDMTPERYRAALNEWRERDVDTTEAPDGR